MARLNDPNEMRIIYQTSKQVFSGDLSAPAACKLLENKTSASEASLKMYFAIYAAMKKGTCYKMGTSASFTQFLIENIYEDDGKEALISALSAAKQNSEYRVSCGNAQPGIETICREIIAKYKLKTRYEDLPTYQEIAPAPKENKPKRASKTVSPKDVEYTQLPNKMLRLKITIGAIVFEAEGDPKTVISQEKRFTTETLPGALAALDKTSGKAKKEASSKNRSRNVSKPRNASTKKNDSVSKESKKSTGETLLIKHPYLTKLKDRMDFKARMIPLMYYAQKDKLQKDFSISEIQKIMFDVLAEQAGKKQIEDVFLRRADWFEKTSPNPRRYKLLEIGCDYAVNIIQE